MLEKIKRIINKLFSDFPFASIKFDYEVYWNKRSRMESSLPSVFKLIAENIDPGSSVLDIGCGDGVLLQYLRQEKEAKVLGVDMSQKAVDLAKARGIEVTKVDITKDNFKLTCSFDYIIMADVLEHVPNAEEVMLKVKGRFNRYLLINLPNTGFIIDRLRLLFGRFPKQWLFHPSEHLRFWTVSDFSHWCRQLGFEVEKYSGNQSKLFWKYWPKLFSREVLYVIKEREAL